MNLAVRVLSLARLPFRRAPAASSECAGSAGVSDPASDDVDFAALEATARYCFHYYCQSFLFSVLNGGPKIERKGNIVIKFDTTVSRAPRESSLIGRRLLVRLNLLKTTRTIDKVTISSLTARIKNKRKSNNPRAGIHQVVAVVSKPFGALFGIVFDVLTRDLRWECYKPPRRSLQLLLFLLKFIQQEFQNIELSVTN